jgi:hypothetical protein
MMAIDLRPKNGGFLRAFGCGWFVREFLLGHGPEGSPVIDPGKGAPMVDIHYAYKRALHTAFARDATDRDNEERVRRGLRAYTAEEYNERLTFYLDRIPIKLVKMRYSSFTRYFDHLKRLGWVETTGYTEPSGIQDSYPNGPPRVFYRLTDAGRVASDHLWSDPVTTLYNYPREQRSAKSKLYLKVRARRRLL